MPKIQRNTDLFLFQNNPFAITHIHSLLTSMKIHLLESTSSENYLHFIVSIITFRGHYVRSFLDVRAGNYVNENLLIRLMKMKRYYDITTAVDVASDRVL